MNVNGSDLVRAVKREFGYVEKNQTGSHLKMAKPDGTKPFTIPMHKPLKQGTLKSILTQIADYEGMTTDEVLTKLKL